MEEHKTGRCPESGEQIGGKEYRKYDGRTVLREIWKDWEERMENNSKKQK